jgi:hypothetical protein
VPAVAITFAFATGFAALWQWVAELQNLEKASLTLVLTITLIVTAYVFNALRPAFRRMWSGTANSFLTWGLYQLLRRWRQRQCRKLSERVKEAHQANVWPTVIAKFRKEAAAAIVAGGSTTPLTSSARARLAKIPGLLVGASADSAMALLGEFTVAYGLFNQADLTPLFRQVAARLEELESAAAMRSQTVASELDLRFGTYETVRPTRLGNILEAQHQYPAKRYQIEAEIFWSRLQAVIPTEYANVIREPRILLDFALTMASLSLWFGLAVATLGPWLLFRFLPWMILSIASGVAAISFYRLAVGAAEQLGSVTRAAFDLYRLPLMTMLGLPWPSTLKQERAQWREVSRLAVYGEVASEDSFTLRPERPA